MKKRLLIISVFTIVLSSCEKDPIPTYLTIHFTHTVDGVPLELTTNNSELPYENAAEQNYNVKKLQYLISLLSIHTESEEPANLKNVHFVDAADPSTLSLELGELQNGLYSGLRFYIGLNENMNITNSYINEDFHTTMAWPAMMGGGYHYMKIEGNFDNDTTFYNTHTGGTMGHDYSYYSTYENNFIFNVDDKMGNVDITINMEINNWYDQPEIAYTTDGIMGNMNMQMALMNNATNVFSTSVVDE